MTTGSSVLEGVLADLEAESTQLESWVAPLDEAGWRIETPAAGWDIATSIAHLSWTDEVAVVAAKSLQGSEGKQAWDELVLRAIADPTGFVDTQALEAGAVPSAYLLARWRSSRPGLAMALRAVTTGEKMPWFGPPMSPTSMATARFMETWAHSLDVADALGIEPTPTDRIRHVAHLGVRTRNFAFANNGLQGPAEEFRISLTAPSGEVWEWGPQHARQTVSGAAYDFCLLVTQRRHRDDLALSADGGDAHRWLDIAQAFAGPSGGGRQPT